MDSLNHFPFYRSTIRRNSSGGCLIYIIILGIASMFAIISFFYPDVVGPWFIWSGLVVILVCLGLYRNITNKGSIKLFKTTNGKIKISLKREKQEILFSFNPTDISYWYNRNYHEGQLSFINYYCIIKGENGNEISLQQISGGKAEQPADWEYLDGKLSDSESFYLNSKMIDFVNAIKNHKG